MFTKSEYWKAIQYLRSRIVLKDFMSPSCIIQEKHRMRRKKNIPINESGPNEMKEIEKCGLCFQRSEEANRKKYIFWDYGKTLVVIPWEINSSKIGGMMI